MSSARFCVVSAFALVMISGCAQVGGYNNPSTRVRDISMLTVGDYSQVVKTFLMTGTQEKAIEQAQIALANSMKDPSSTQFRNVRLVKYLEGNVICGEVNGKNSYGGYVGFTPFVASTSSAVLYDNDAKYPDIQAASNSGLRAACGW
jgi:hypothetical protein